MNSTAHDGLTGEFAIRHAVEADAAALSGFAAHVFAETFAPDNAPLDMQAYLSDAFTPEKQAAEIADPTCVCLLADVGGSMAGYALLRLGAAAPHVPAKYVTQYPVELQRFYVAHAWHGTGVAWRLMAACMEIAQARGGAMIWLGVWERNARAIRFYEKQGFTDIGTQPFQLGSDLQTDRVMARSVGDRD